MQQIQFMVDTDISASRNIGFPDSLLSRFYLCFVVLDEHNSEMNRKISERVINNHMFTNDAPNILNDNEDKVIESEIEENKEKNIKCMKNIIKIRQNLFDK